MSGMVGIARYLNEIGSSQFVYGQFAGPRTIAVVVDPRGDGLDVSGVELFGFAEELQARVRVDDVLNKIIPIFDG